MIKAAKAGITEAEMRAGDIYVSPYDEDAPTILKFEGGLERYVDRDKAVEFAARLLARPYLIFFF